MDERLRAAVLGYTAKETQQNRLGVGSHIVALVAYNVLHSRINWDGSEKSNLPDFADPTPQLGIMVRNDHGVQWHRFNMSGYKRWSDLSDAQQESGKFTKVIFGDNAYACTTDKKGRLVRIEDEQRTSDACNILDQFMAAIGGTGKAVGEHLDMTVSQGTKFQIKIEDREYEGEEQLRITRFSKVAENAEVEDDFSA